MKLFINTNKKGECSMNKITIRSFVLPIAIIILSIIANSSSSSNAFASFQLPKDTIQFYSKNNILYYNPLGSIDCYSNSSASLTEGKTYEEKIWNYFVNANIPNVSNNPAVIAGILGNFKQESGYDPFVENEDGYAGVFQGDAHADYHIFLDTYNKVTEVAGDYWFISDVGNVNNHPEQANITAITIELDSLTKNEPKTAYYNQFQSFINHLDDVTYKTPSSYAELFQIEVERGVCRPHEGRSCEGHSQAITDPGVLNRAQNEIYPTAWGSNGYWYQGMHDRMQKAEEIYKTYGSQTDSPSSSSILSVQSNTNGSTEDCYHSSSEDFVRYDQTDSAYASYFYDSESSGGMKSSVSASACGPFSFAMLANALGIQNIDPIEVTNIAGQKGMHAASGGSNHNITKTLAEYYKMEYEKIDTEFKDGTFGNNLSSDDLQKVTNIISKYLKNGWMIHVSGTSQGGDDSPHGQPFTPHGHYIGIRGITQDGKWLLADSNGPNGKTENDYTPSYKLKGKENSTKEWDPITVIKDGMNVGNIHAIRASSTSTCGDVTTSPICDNVTGNGTLISGGMTLEQAKEYMKNYENIAKQKLPASTYSVNDTQCIGGSYYNCVAFTQYFITVNTNKKAPDLGNGVVVVSQLIQKNLAQDGGHTPKIYAVFSQYIPDSAAGHTGIVLGITDKSIIIGEANCHSSKSHYTTPGAIRAREISIEEATGKNYTYAYLYNLTIGGGNV